MGRNRSMALSRRTGAIALGLVVALAGCGNRETPLEGERFGTRVPLAATLTGDAETEADAQADVARAINLPAANTFSSWAQRGYDAQNATPHAALSPNLTQVWSTNIGAGNSRRNRLTADPVAGNGAVFTLDATAGVRAHSVSNGGLIWSADLTAGFDRGGNVSGGGLALSGDTLYATTGYGELVALDAASGAVPMAAAAGRGHRGADRFWKHRLRGEPRQQRMGDFDRCGPHPLGTALRAGARAASWRRGASGLRRHGGVPLRHG